MKLYVGRLSYDTTEVELRELFARYGDLVSVHLLTDGAGGRSKGFGFVEFTVDEEAQAAIAGLNGSELGGRAIVVSEARPKRDRSRGGPERQRGRSGDDAGSGWTGSGRGHSGGHERH